MRYLVYGGLIRESTEVVVTTRRMANDHLLAGVRLVLQSIASTEVHSVAIYFYRFSRTYTCHLRHTFGIADLLAARTASLHGVNMKVRQ